jgi:hypothetical protein
MIADRDCIYCHDRAAHTPAECAEASQLTRAFAAHLAEAMNGRPALTFGHINPELAVTASAHNGR